MSQTNAKPKKVGKDLTVGPVLPLLISFALPMVLTNLIQQLYSMVDLMIIGKYVGSVGTVGVSTGGELSDLMTPIASAFATAGQIYIAQLAGQKNREKMNTVIGTLLTLMGGVSFVAVIVTLLFYKQILGALNCPGEAFDSAAGYLLITAIGMPFIFGYNGICAILRGMGESKRPLLFVAIAATINIFLDLLLVVVFHLDAAGTAIATVVSQIGAFVASLIYMIKRKEAIGFEWKLKNFKMNMHDLGVILKLGIPQMIRVGSVQGSMLWVKANINGFGLVASATYSVGNKIDKLIMLFVQGVDGAGGAMIGQNLGARKLDRVNEIMKKMLLTSLSLAVFAAAAFYFLPTQLYSLFTNDPEVIEYGKIFLRIMMISCFVNAFSGATKSITTGAGAALLSLIIGVLDGVTRVLICLIALAIMGHDAAAFFWGAALCQLIPGIVSGIYFLSGKWKTKKLLSEA